MIQSGTGVVEKGQEVLAETEKAVRLRFVEEWQAQMLLVEISGATHVSYPYGDVVESDSMKRGGASRGSLR